MFVRNMSLSDFRETEPLYGAMIRAADYLDIVGSDTEGNIYKYLWGTSVSYGIASMAALGTLKTMGYVSRSGDQYSVTDKWKQLVG